MTKTINDADEGSTIGELLRKGYSQFWCFSCGASTWHKPIQKEQKLKYGRIKRGPMLRECVQCGFKDQWPKVKFKPTEIVKIDLSMRRTSLE